MEVEQIILDDMLLQPSMKRERHDKLAFRPLVVEEPDRHPLIVVPAPHEQFFARPQSMVCRGDFRVYPELSQRADE